MYVTDKHLSRRAVLRGVGATVALPYLSAMLPASRLTAGQAPGGTRLVAIEMVHGAAGSNTIGIQKNLWAPAAVGKRQRREDAPRPEGRRRRERVAAG